MGDLVALMMTLKSLPLAYNKDLQEDKEGAMDAADTLEDCYVCAAGMIATMTVNADAMATQAKKGYLAATDVADYLAKKGLPFRRAHEIVGHLVLLCDQRGCDLEDLTLDDFKAESDLFESDIVECLNLPRHCRRPHHLRRHGPRRGTRAAGCRQGATRRFWSLVYCQSAFKRSLVNREFCCIPLRHKRLRLRRSFLYAVFRFGLCYNRATTTASDMLAYNFRAAVQLHRKPGQESICHSRFSCGLPVLKSLRLW